MALASAAVMPSAPTSQTENVAVVAPYGDAGRHAQVLAHRGWASVAVALSEKILPAAHRGADGITAYQHQIVHAGGLRRTLKQLRDRRVSAVIPGSGLGVELADQLARDLRLPGNDPETSSLRRDRGAQATALSEAGMAAPRSLCTDSLLEALNWAEFCCLPAYVVSIADSSALTPPALCRTPAEIAIAWRSLRRRARYYTGTTNLVIQEHLPGQQYIVHSISSPVKDEHIVTEVWAEQRTSHGLHVRSDLAEGSLRARSVSLYTARALRVLGVQFGPTRCRIVFNPGRGPVLLSARAYAASSPANDLAQYVAGADLLQGGAPGMTPSWSRRYGTDHGFVSRVSLISPHDGILDQRLVHTLTTLPTIARVIGPLVAGTLVQRTVDRASSPGEVVLSASSRRAIEEDYRVIRALEALGLYDGVAL